jgi:hypothetical protein
LGTSAISPGEEEVLAAAPRLKGALGPRKLAHLATRAPLESFSPLSIFRPTSLWKWLNSYSRGVLGKKAPFPTPTANGAARMFAEKAIMKPVAGIASVIFY